MSDDVVRYVGQVIDSEIDPEPITVKIADGAVWLETILLPTREIIETEMTAEGARALSDLLARAADEVDQ